jgi:uncharacterized membrane protein
MLVGTEMRVTIDTTSADTGCDDLSGGDRTRATVARPAWTQRHRRHGVIRHRAAVSAVGRLRPSCDRRLKGVEVSDLIAITFDGWEQAGEALQALRQVERRGLIHLTDTAVVQKDADGHVHTENELDSGVEMGIGVTGTLGLLVGIAFPIAGIAAGVAGGAWAGSKMQLGIDKKFLESLQRDLRPGTSALLLMVSNVKPHAIPTVREAMRPYHGTVYETTLSPEAQRNLHEVVEAWQNTPTP